MQKNQTKQAHLAFCEAISGKIQVSHHAVKLIGQAVLCFLRMRTSNLAVIANTMETEVLAASNYKRLQRFVKRFRWRGCGFQRWVFELLGIEGKLDLIVDRTEWQFGRVWINLMMVSVEYRGLAIPVGWKVFSQKGNLRGAKHVRVLRAVIGQLGRERIRKVFADREFCNREVFGFLYEQDLDFCIRLKKNYRASGWSLKELMVKQTMRVKLKSKRKQKVLGYLMGVSAVRISASEYLIVATREVEEQALNEYRKRWGIETLFGCLKSRGFDFEETHLWKRSRIERLTFLLTLAYVWAIKTGELKTKGQKRKVKNTGRLEKSLFRVGLDYLQNLLVNLHLPSKFEEFNLLARLLSCT